MRINRSHIPWFIFVLLASAASTGLYVANFHPELLPSGIKLPDFFGEAPPVRNTHGGTVLGLLFGTAAFAIFIFASALGVRKKKKLWPIGNVQFWLKAHIWLTILTIPLVAFHSGFRTGGPHTTVLMVLYGIVMVTGFLGILLQQFMPHLMRESLPREVVFEQIPYLRERLLEEATRLREPIAEAVRSGTDHDQSAVILCKFLDAECLPFLAAKHSLRHPLGNAQAAAEIFRNIRVNVADQWRPRLSKLENWCEQRRLMDLQAKYHHWLHGWLLIHVPFSFALLILTAWHAWIGILFLISAPH